MRELIAQLKAGRIRNLGEFKALANALRTQFDAPDESYQRFIGEVPTVKPGDLSRLFQPSFFQADNYLRQGARADWQNTSDEIRTFAALLLEALRKRGVPMFVHCAYRDALTQARLKASGHSNALFPRAPHCQGEAVDIVHARYAWNLAPEEWATIGKIGLDIAERIGVPVNWGGDETNLPEPFTDAGDTFRWDPAHWEIADWRDRIELTYHETEPIHMMPRKLLREHPVAQLARS